jgi:hypothetical protein
MHTIENICLIPVLLLRQRKCSDGATTANGTLCRSCYVADVPLAVIRQMSGQSEDLSEPPDVLWSAERTRSEISGTP